MQSTGQWTFDARGTPVARSPPQQQQQHSGQQYAHSSMQVDTHNKHCHILPTHVVQNLPVGATAYANGVGVHLQTAHYLPAQNNHVMGYRAPSVPGPAPMNSGGGRHLSIHQNAPAEPPVHPNAPPRFAGAARKRQRAAQRRYREKRRRIEQEMKDKLSQLKQENDTLEPLKAINEITREGPRPKFWSLVLKSASRYGGELSVLASWQHKEALGYDMIGKRCEHYSRARGMPKNCPSKTQYVEQVIARANADVNRQEVPLNDEPVLEKAIYEKKRFHQDGSFEWIWVQCMAKVLSEPGRMPIILHVVEMDVHDAVGMGQELSKMKQSNQNALDQTLEKKRQDLMAKKLELAEADQKSAVLHAEIATLEQQIEVVSGAKRKDLSLRNQCVRQGTKSENEKVG